MVNVTAASPRGIYYSLMERQQVVCRKYGVPGNIYDVHFFPTVSRRNGDVVLSSSHRKLEMEKRGEIAEMKRTFPDLPWLVNDIIREVVSDSYRVTEKIRASASIEQEQDKVLFFIGLNIVPQRLFSFLPTTFLPYRIRIEGVMDLLLAGAHCSVVTFEMFIAGLLQNEAQALMPLIGSEELLPQGRFTRDLDFEYGEKGASLSEHAVLSAQLAAFRLLRENFLSSGLLLGGRHPVEGMVENPNRFLGEAPDRIWVCNDWWSAYSRGRDLSFACGERETPRSVYSVGITI